MTIPFLYRLSSICATGTDLRRLCKGSSASLDQVSFSADLALGRLFIVKFPFIIFYVKKG